ncbi:MAG: hypothetical protein ACE14V_03335 [bacterium]
MKKFNWQIVVGLSLVILSGLFYLVDYLIYKEQFYIYFISDIAFLPVQVLLVTLIVNELMKMRERRALLKKMNMVIGSFFSEVGLYLFKSFRAYDINYEAIQKCVLVKKDWTEKEFSAAKKQLLMLAIKIDSRNGDLETMKQFLTTKRGFLLGLLQNQNLLEHESFTELLWAVFHLTEELSYRTHFTDLPKSDYDHLSTDIKRAYIQLLLEWLGYMQHLQNQYPYLFSLAIRTNPFDPHASVIIQ